MHQQQCIYACSAPPLRMSSFGQSSSKCGTTLIRVGSPQRPLRTKPYFSVSKPVSIYPCRVRGRLCSSALVGHAREPTRAEMSKGQTYPSRNQRGLVLNTALYLLRNCGRFWRAVVRCKLRLEGGMPDAPLTPLEKSLGFKGRLRDPVPSLVSVVCLEQSSPCNRL